MSLLAKIAAAKAARVETRSEVPPRPSSPSTGSLPSLPSGEGLSEGERICRLPRVSYEGADLTSELRIAGGTFSLFPIQSEALEAVRHANGLLGPIAVGEGKTFPALLASEVLDCDFALVLTKAKLVEQTRDAMNLLRNHFRLRPTRIASYASLSRVSGARMLDEIAERWNPE